MSKNTNRKLFAASASAALVASAVVPTGVLADQEIEQVFPDVPTDHEAAQQVADLYNAGVISGYEDKTFKPGNQVTRAEVSDMVAGILDLDKNVPSADFPDVKKNAWYTGSINALAAEGHIQGYEDGTFKPSGQLTRAEFAKLIVEAYDLEIERVDLPFDDLKDNVWYSPYIETLYANDLIKGQTETKFGPSDNIKRIDLALLLANTDYEFGTKLKPENALLEINSVNAINPNTIEVSFEGVADPVEIELDEELVDGENEVTFEYEGKEYTTTVDFDEAAYEEALAVEEATKAVDKAADSYKKKDIDEAQELVDNLSESDEKVLLDHRLSGINKDLKDLVNDVNKAVEADSTNALNKALSQKPFENYTSDNRNAYMNKLKEEATDTASIADIQKVIDDVNDTVTSNENSALVKTIDNALGTAEDFDADNTAEQKTFDDAIAEAQKAIDKLPADWVAKDEDDNEYNVKENYQEQLDELVSLNDDYVNRVKNVVEAKDDYGKNVALTDGNFDFVEDNLQNYDFDGKTKVEEIEYEIQLTDADQAIDAFEVDADTTQADLDALKDMVPRTGEKNDEGDATANEAEQNLLDKIDTKETEMKDLKEATKVLNEAVADAEKAQADYLAAGGEKKDDVYKKVTTALETADEADLNNVEKINSAKKGLTPVTESLQDETNKLTANADAIQAAEEAQEAYLAAGGKKEDDLYTNVSGAVEANNLDAIKNATDEIKTETEAMELVNAINDATTPAELEAELVKLENGDYNNLTKQQRLEVADATLKSLAEEDAEFTTKTELSTLVDTNIENYNSSIDDVNNAIVDENDDKGTTTDVRDALNKLDIDEFNNLSASEKLTAAENVKNNQPKDGYKTISGIVAQF